MVFRKAKVSIDESAVEKNITTELLAFPIFRIVRKSGPLNPCIWIEHVVKKGCRGMVSRHVAAFDRYGFSITKQIMLGEYGKIHVGI